MTSLIEAIIIVLESSKISDIVKHSRERRIHHLSKIIHHAGELEKALKSSDTKTINQHSKRLKYHVSRHKHHDDTIKKLGVDY